MKNTLRLSIAMLLLLGAVPRPQKALDGGGGVPCPPPPALCEVNESSR